MGGKNRNAAIWAHRQIGIDWQAKAIKLCGQALPVRSVPIDSRARPEGRARR